MEKYLILAAILTPLFGAWILDARHRRMRPQCRPFGWGYFNGICCLAAPIVIGSHLDAHGFSLLVIIAVYIPVGILILRRNRWALVAGTILYFNPIVWIINGFYIAHRWNELRSPQKGVPPSPFNPTNSTPPPITQHDQTVQVARGLDLRFAPPPPPPSSITREDSESLFFVDLNAEVKGPFSIEQLKALLEVGSLTLDSKCCAKGSPSWVSVRHVI